MNDLIVQQKKKIKSWLINRLFSFSGSTYQRDRFPQEKFRMIASRLDMSRIGSVLDVGCNEGFITAEFAKQGKFCVGVDGGPYYLNHVLNDLDNVFGRQSAAFGVFRLADNNVGTIPEFDLILLLSVHHQLINRFGNEYTERLVRDLIEKSKRYFVIEFASTADKYGFKKPRFEDNDEESIKAYANSWLQNLKIPGTVEYIGKNKEHSEGNEREPYRFMFLISKSA